MFNPNRFVVNVDDIYGIRRVNLAETIKLPGVNTFFASPTEVPFTSIDVFNTRFVKDTFSPATAQPDFSDSAWS